MVCFLSWSWSWLEEQIWLLWSGNGAEFCSVSCMNSANQGAIPCMWISGIQSPRASKAIMFPTTIIGNQSVVLTSINHITSLWLNHCLLAICCKLSYLLVSVKTLRLSAVICCVGGGSNPSWWSARRGPCPLDIVQHPVKQSKVNTNNTSLHQHWQHLSNQLLRNCIDNKKFIDLGRFKPLETFLKSIRRNSLEIAL